MTEGSDSFPPFHETASHLTKGLPKPKQPWEAAIEAAEAASKPTCEHTGKHVCKYCGKELPAGV